MSAAMQVLLALALVSVCSAGDWVYITNPIEGYLHPAGEEVDILVNSLTSTDAMVPYEYYTLPFCAAPENTRWQADNLLGSALWGDSIMSSPYSVSFLKNMTCVSACPLNDMAMLNKDELQQMKRFILDGYRGNMILDKLPALRTSLIDPSPSALAELCSKNQVPEREKEVRGYPLGSCKNSEVYINNHLSFTVKYNEKVVEGQKLYFVVGFYVVPRSFAEAGCASQQRMTTALPKGSKQKEMHWTYSVSWELDPTVQWVTRWDNYLNSSEGDKNARAHWLKIAQFLIVVLCLSAIVAVILMRTLHLDFNRYNNPENEEEMQEEVGWKLVHTEVFRPPPYPNLFAALIGTGTQLYLMVVITLMIAMAGFLSPAHRGWFLTALIFLFILMSIVNGFVTGMLQMMFSVKQWKTIILSGLCFPGFMFSLWTISEILLANKHAANAVPIGTYFIVLLMWIGIYVPQMVLGASFAFRLPPIENTLRYSTQKKTVPPQRWWFSWIATILLPGFLPYSAAFYEITLINRAIWQGQVYYVFTFLAIVIFVVTITISETVIVYIYHQLVFEDYRWWWKSFFVPTGMGVYMMLLSIHYYMTVLNVKTWLAAWLYFVFSSVLAIMTSIVAGSIGFFAAWLFIRKIYGSIKIE